MLSSPITDSQNPHLHHHHHDNCCDDDHFSSLIPANCPLDLSGRKRVSKACLECKKRHCRCDHQRPCARCAKLNLECVDAPTCKRGPPKGTCYKKRKRESTSSADDTDAKSNAAAVTVSHHQASPSNAEVKLHMEPRNKKRRISELSHNNNVNSQAPFQVKQEQLLHDLFSSMNGATTSIQQPFAMTTNHPSVVGFHPFMLPTADMMQSFPMNLLPAQQSSITTNMPLVSSVHNTPVMPMFPVKREVEEAEASNDCCVGDCDSGCDSNDGACLSLFEQQIESVKMRMEQPMSPSALALELTDLPDIEDLTVGMCMNTSCGANHNRSCLISDLDLLSDNQPILDDVDSLFNHSDPLFVSSEEPSSPLSLDTAFDLDLELGNVVSSGLNSDSYSAFPRSLSMQQFDEDFLLS